MLNLLKSKITTYMDGEGDDPGEATLKIVIEGKEEEIIAIQTKLMLLIYEELK